MSESRMDRRDFVKTTAMAAAGMAAAGAIHLKPGQARADVDTSKILNYNENMEYRRCGKTGLMISAVCLGGHWKRIEQAVPDVLKGRGWLSADLGDSGFLQNRHDVVSRCMDLGINYIDACTGAEVQAYSKVLKGRRDKMYLGFSWYEHEMRFAPHRESVDNMMKAFDEGLQKCELEYVDLWRITMQEQTGRRNSTQEIEIAMECLDRAKKQGKARFTGVSSHDRDWLADTIQKYPDQMDVIVTPYTSRTKQLPEHSLFDTIAKCDVGFFGIKPFASNSLFKGNSAPGNPHAEEDDRTARLAIRYILCNPVITAPIPGMINEHQVENVAKAVTERRELDEAEKAELEAASERMMASLPRHYDFLRNWEYV